MQQKNQNSSATLKLLEAQAKLTEGEDIKAYLTTFERMMAAHEANKEKWAFKLAPNLSSKAQLEYAAMNSNDARSTSK